jgi:hypothetical protein
MMAIVYSTDLDAPESVIVEPLNLNGREGAWNLTFGEDQDEEISFEDTDTFRQWMRDVVAAAQQAGIDLGLHA